jgi:hypothetical protein
MKHAPNVLLEIVDGTFLMLLFFKFGTTARYTVLSTRRDILASGWNPLTWGPESKAAWALTVIFAGLILRVGSHWSLRHAASHGLDWHAFTDQGPNIVLVSTMMTIWGGICWIRTVIPLRCGPVTWTWAVIFAVAFGVWMAT